MFTVIPQLDDIRQPNNKLKMGGTLFSLFNSTPYNQKKQARQVLRTPFLGAAVFQFEGVLM